MVTPGQMGHTVFTCLVLLYPLNKGPHWCRDAFEFAYAMRELPESEAEAAALPQPRFQSWFGRLPALPEQAKRGLREADLGALQAR